MLLLLSLLGVLLLILLCVIRPRLSNCNFKMIKIINKTRCTSCTVRRRRRRRPMVLESSTSSEADNEPSTSAHPNWSPGASAQHSGSPSLSPTPPPPYEPRRGPVIDELHNSSDSGDDTPPPPYAQLRSSSASSQGSTQTIRSNIRPESEEREMLYRDDSPSEWEYIWK